MASRGVRTGGARNRAAGLRPRWRRRTILVQGGYYLVTGAWPLLHFPSFARLVDLPINPFQAHAFAALVMVVGACLLEAGRRGDPGAYPTMLGAAVAVAIALVEIVWLPRFGGLSGLWLDLPVEVAFALALGLLYPRRRRKEPETYRRR